MLEFFDCDKSYMLSLFYILKNVINILRIVVPIILIIMAMFDFFRIVSGSGEIDARVKKKLMGRVLSAVMVFLVPTLSNAVLGIVNVGDLSASACFTNATKENIALYKEQEEEAERKEKEARVSEIKAKEQAAYEAGRKVEYAKNAAKESNPDGGGVLIIAGHSYSGECNLSGDCRGTFAGSGYAEEEETRSLALSLKEALLSEGVNAVIANQILVGDTNSTKMDASFYGATKGRSHYASAFKELEKEGYWKSFDHAIEIHFNASQSHTAYGTMVMTSIGKESLATEMDRQILAAVSDYTGYNRGVLAYSNGGLRDFEYFHGINVPITYIEVEFYDNKSAMDKYKKNQEKIAKAIAEVFKEKGY